MPARQTSTDKVKALLRAAPTLAAELDTLCHGWLRHLLLRLDDISRNSDLLPATKQINDPVWKLITVKPEEILLLDSSLMQRLRGVRQLGLAHLVFPGATHDRFSHACGVLEASSRMFDALVRNASEHRQSEREKQTDGQQLDGNARWIVRMAALLHDIGHGPFSHAVEPVVRQRYASEITAFNEYARTEYNLNENLGVAEVIAVLVVLSTAMKKVFDHSAFPRPKDAQTIDLLWKIAVLIMGGRHMDFNTGLSAIISGQVDADKLDYMVRDAHHSGMPIAFDTERLLGKLELIRCTPDSLPPPTTDEDKRKLQYAEDCNGKYYDVGIVHSGVGALEQMLVGRAFLYDRLYFHHKVRAADAMAQRLLLFAQSAGEPFELRELYLDLADDTLIRLLGGIVMIGGHRPPSEGAAELATDILERRLYHRAIAFRARFHHTDAETMSAAARADLCASVWSPLSTDMSDFDKRVQFERDLFEECRKLAQALPDSVLGPLMEDLRPWHIVVDLPENRVKAVSIYVSGEDGMLELPNLFFDPARWSQVYNLEKRTGYVFCPQKFIPLVAPAARILLLRRWNYVSARKADRLTKTVGIVPDVWFERLAALGHIDTDSAALLCHKATLRRRARDREVSDSLPEIWGSDERRRLASRITGRMQASLPMGLESKDVDILLKVICALSHYVQDSFASPPWTHKGGLDEVKEMQPHLTAFIHAHLNARQDGTSVVESNKLAGGLTDILVGDRLIIENKVAGPGDDPFTALPAAALQAARYERALSHGCLVTVVAYKPKDEAAYLAPPKSVQAFAHTIGGRNIVEIRFAVAYGQGTPSSAKPSSRKAGSRK